MQSRTNIVAFAGRMFIGKTTMAEKLADELHGDIGKSIELLSFANHLKESVKKTFMLEDYHVYTAEGKAEYIEWLGCTPRDLLQSFGTEYIRNTVRRDFWVRIVGMQIDRIHKIKPDVVVILDDIRFEDEAELIRKLGGIVVHLDRDIPNDSARQLTIFQKILEKIFGIPQVHESERKLNVSPNDIDLFLPNNIDEAYAMVIDELTPRLDI